MVSKPDLPDLNVWLALSAREHPHHASAREYWTVSASRQVLFCRATVLGLLRLITNEVVMGGQPLSPREAVKAYGLWRQVDDVGLAREPSGTETELFGLVGRDLVPARMWSDAYLAAFAKAGGMRVVTFDRDFLRFDGIELLLLDT